MLFPGRASSFLGERPRVGMIICIRRFSRQVVSGAPPRSRGKAVATPTHRDILRNLVFLNLSSFLGKISGRSGLVCLHAASASTYEIIPETCTSTSDILSSVSAYFKHASCHAVFRLPILCAFSPEDILRIESASPARGFCVAFIG